MIKIDSIHDPQIASIPPPHHGAVMSAVKNLCSILGPDPHPEDQGLVVFIESEDLPEIVNSANSKDISTCLEGVFCDGNCRVGVVLYGNSGSGVTIVSPDVENYASTITHILRKHLS